MFNPYKLRKYSAYAICSVLSMASFFIGLLTMNNVWWALVFFAVGALIAVVVSNVLLRSAWQSMLEGQGIMVLNLDSTGIVSPFVVGIEQKSEGLFLKGLFGKQVVNDPFDRRLTGKLKEPSLIQNGAYEDKETGDLIIRIPQKEFHKQNMFMEHYPLLFYNQITNSLVTKEFLSGQEKELMVEHLLSYLRHEVRKLSDELHNLVRSIMDMLAPSGGGIFSGKFGIWLIIGLVVVGVILLFMFGPNILGIFKGAVAPAAQAASSAAHGAATAGATAIHT